MKNRRIIRIALCLLLAAWLVIGFCIERRTGVFMVFGWGFGTVQQLLVSALHREPPRRGPSCVQCWMRGAQAAAKEGRN